jgi:hypothetical protein
VMHGRGRPETMGYADAALHAAKDAHLKVAPTASVVKPI